HVRVEGSTGDVHVLGDDGTTVRVTARIRASSDAAAAKVGVDVARSGDESVVTVTVPESSPSFLHWIFDRRRISVDLVVRVPRRSGITAHQSTGDLDVRGIAGAIDARSSTGDVHLHAPPGLRAHVETHTSVGDVHNALGNANVASPVIEAHTSVGDVTISTR
nr:DUF4097 domain-containing protein [Candidatus Eremiobacteraeota bacterium]